MAERKERTLPKGTIFRRTEKQIPELEAEKGVKKEKGERIKATFYLYPEDILAIDYIQSEEFKRSRKKPERSEIVSKAIQLLRQQTG
jgi:predicted Ser/Thr protein kinase